MNLGSRISIQRLYPRRFRIMWIRDTRVLLIGLYFVTMGIDFGLKKSAWWNHFNKNCGYCDRKLHISSRFTRTRYHRGRCRKMGRREERRLRKEARKNGTPAPVKKGIFARIFHV